MATISSKEIVNEIIAGDGYYSDDPRVKAIFEIQTPTAEGVTRWVLCYTERDIFNAMSSEWVVNPKLIWSDGSLEEDTDHRRVVEARDQ